MSLRPVESRRLSDQVFERLASEIIEGRHPAGASLPSERALVEVYGVNRHVIREALKRLSQLGLVKVAQGGNTKVLDFRKNAGLDLLALMAEYARGGADIAGHWLAVLEMRAAIATDMVRLCAKRAPADIKERLVSLAESMKAADDDAHLYALEVEFWDTVIEGANNIAYRLAFNTMLKGADSVRTLAVRWSAEESRAAGHRLATAEAIRNGDADGAERDTRGHMRRAVERFEKRVASVRSESSAQGLAVGDD